MLLRTIFFALAISLAAAPPSHAETPGFLADVDDLPLAPGLVEEPAARVVFDKPAGRIVEAAASGDVAREAVQRFYSETLPGLGWTPRGAGVWERGGERLTIGFEQAGPATVVRYSLTPGS